MAGYQHRTILVGDIKTHFLEAGSGPDLVLLHGGEYGASAEITWRAQYRSAGANVSMSSRLIFSAGVRQTKFIASPIPPACASSILQRFLETLGIGKACFVGNSAGGGLILERVGAQPGAVSNSKNGHNLRQCQRVQDQPPKPTWKTTRRRWRT